MYYYSTVRIKADIHVAAVPQFPGVRCQQREVEGGKFSFRNSSSLGSDLHFPLRVTGSRWARLTDTLLWKKKRKNTLLDFTHLTFDTVNTQVKVKELEITVNLSVFSVFTHIIAVFFLFFSDSKVTTDSSPANCYVMDLRGGGERERGREREWERGRLLHSLSILLFSCQLQHACLPLCYFVASCLNTRFTLVSSICLRPDSSVSSFTWRTQVLYGLPRSFVFIPAESFYLFKQSLKKKQQKKKRETLRKISARSARGCFVCHV